MSNSKNFDADERTITGIVTETGFPPPKLPEADDPMQLKAQMVAGDPQVMLDCLIEEFARMGWDANQIAQIFEDPFFQASHGLTKRFGNETIRDRIEQTLERCGVFHFEIIE